MSASLQDFIAGLDPTGYISVSGAELLQMLQAATPYTDKGQIITTTDAGGVADVPDAVTNTKWTKYLWKRITANSVILYVWNDLGSTNFSGPGFQKWYTVNSASIASGSITNSMLAGLITSDKISGLDWSKLSGVPNLITTATELVGDVGGTPTATVLGDGVVDPNHINALTGAKLVQRSFTRLGTWIGTNVAIPYDDTIPQLGEGTATGLSINFLPKALTNYLKFTFKAVASSDIAAGVIIAAIFNGAVGNAIGAVAVSANEDELVSIQIEHIVLVSTLMGALTTTAFSVRYGTGTADYVYLGGTSAAGKLGRVMSMQLVIEEYRP